MAKEIEPQQTSEDLPNNEQLTRLWKNAEFIRQFVICYGIIKSDYNPQFEGDMTTIRNPSDVYIVKKGSPYFASADIDNTDSTSKWLHIDVEKENSLFSISFGFENDFALDLFLYNPTDGLERSYRRKPADKTQMTANEYLAITSTLNNYIDTVIIGFARN